MVRRGWTFHPASSTVFPTIRLQRDPPPAKQRCFKGNMKEGNPEEQPNGQPKLIEDSRTDSIDPKDADYVAEVHYYEQELRTVDTVLLKLNGQLRDDQFAISAQKLQQNISYQEDLKKQIVLKIERALNQKED